MDMDGLHVIYAGILHEIGKENKIENTNSNTEHVNYTTTISNTDTNSQ